jgi:hypothetical protein
VVKNFIYDLYISIAQPGFSPRQFPVNTKAIKDSDVVNSYKSTSSSVSTPAESVSHNSNVNAVFNNTVYDLSSSVNVITTSSSGNSKSNGIVFTKFVLRTDTDVINSYFTPLITVNTYTLYVVTGSSIIIS